MSDDNDPHRGQRMRFDAARNRATFKRHLREGLMTITEIPPGTPIYPSYDPYLPDHRIVSSADNNTITLVRKSDGAILGAITRGEPDPPKPRLRVVRRSPT